MSQEAFPADSNSKLKEAVSVVDLSLVLVWCYRLLIGIGPILTAVNAAWSLYNKIRSGAARKESE